MDQRGVIGLGLPRIVIQDRFRCPKIEIPYFYLRAAAVPGIAAVVRTLNRDRAIRRKLKPLIFEVSSGDRGFIGVIFFYAIYVYAHGLNYNAKNKKTQALSPGFLIQPITHFSSDTYNSTGWLPGGRPLVH